MIIRLVCLGQPVSGKNHKRGFVNKHSGKVVVVGSQAAKKWAAAQIPLLARQFALYRLPMLKGPVCITLWQYLKLEPKHKNSPDGDNVQSAVWDALTKALVISDDRNAVLWAGGRFQGAEPRVEIEIATLSHPVTPEMVPRYSATTGGE